MTVQTCATPWKLWAMPKQPLKDLPDEIIMARIARRDEPAFAELCRRFLKRMYRFDMQFFQSRPEAEDAVQEKFLRVWQRADQFRYQQGSTVMNYLLKIDKNICLDMLRRAVRKREMLLPGPGHDAPEESDLLDYLDYCHRCGEKDGESGEVQLQASELTEQIYRFTREKFSPRQFLVFWGFVTGMSYKEIAATYDLEEGSVRGLIARGFARVREAFGDERSGS